MLAVFPKYALQHDHFNVITA